MRIGILDPWLVDVGGHFLDWDLRIAHGLVTLGHEVRLYSNAALSSRARGFVPEQFHLSPTLHIDCFAHPPRVDPVAGELVLFLDGASTLAEDLARVGDSDLWIWPSLTASHLYACAQAGPKVGISACIHEEPTHLRSHGRMWWRYAFLRAARAGLRLNLGTTTERLAEEFAGLSAGVGIRRFPVPHDGAPSGVRKTELRRIGFFGAQRFEKGAQLLPALIPRLLQDGYEVVLQDSAGLVRARAMQGLTVLGYLPSLADEIARCDLVVVPYDATRYRIRGSGILWDCIASGVPTIVPAGTELGLQAQSAGMGKTFASFSAGEVYRSIVEARRDYPQMAGAAYEASRRWQAAEGTGRFLAAMTGDAHAAGAAPHGPA